MNPVPLAGGANASGSLPVVGIISDTHGLLRPEALAALAGCDHLIHAGDLGRPEVFEELCLFAPAVAIRGNVDRGPWAKEFPETLGLQIGGTHIYVLHDLQALALDPVFEKMDVVVSGHSHRPAIKQQAGVLYVNPGSAGPRRFSLPVTVVRLTIGPLELKAELVDVLTHSLIATVRSPRRQASA